MSEPILDIDDLTVTYQDGGQTVTAVADANLTIRDGEYQGLVGESGSGKSTLAKTVIGALDDNGTIESGTIRYKGEEIQDMSTRQLNKEIRWKEISWIPQSSMNSLDPLKRISQQAIELAKVHTDFSKAETKERLSEAFEIVGLPPSRITDYPHEFSGGMNQRAIIALSIFLKPSLIIADEPTTALDVIMQDQIFRHLEELRERDTTILLITHDISLVFEFCDSISIMHAAQIAETGPVGEIYSNPRHPYTILLQEAFPDFHDTNKELSEIEGYPPQLGPDPDFCSFADRCPWAAEECYDGQPALEPVGEEDVRHTVACVRHDEIDRENPPAQPTGELTDD
jgi:oligopeptide/dipeptide ABC transporter ATP-binding protein